MAVAIILGISLRVVNADRVAQVGGLMSPETLATLVAFLRSLFEGPRPNQILVVDRAGDHEICIRRGQDRAVDAERALVALAEAFGLTSEHSTRPYWSNAPLRFNGQEQPFTGDLHREAITRGVKIQMNDRFYWVADLLRGVDLRGADLSLARLEGGHEHKLVADLRNAHPREKIAELAPAIDLAQSQLDSEQVEEIVLRAWSENWRGVNELLPVIANPTCSWEQACELEEILLGMKREAYQQESDRRNLLRAHAMPAQEAERRASELPEEEIDEALSHNDLHPAARLALVARRMARFPEPWRLIAPNSVSVQHIGEDDKEPEPNGEKIARFWITTDPEREKNGPIPMDIFADRNWVQESCRHLLDLFLAEDGELTALLRSYHYDEYAQWESIQTVGVVWNAETLFSGCVNELLAERIKAQEMEIERLKAEFERKLTTAEGTLARLRNLS